MAEQWVQQRLAAILAADVVGYSRPMEQDVTGILSRLRTGHGPENMADVKHMALNILRHAEPATSLKIRRKLAGWNSTTSIISSRARHETIHPIPPDPTAERLWMASSAITVNAPTAIPASLMARPKAKASAGNMAQRPVAMKTARACHASGRTK